MIQEGFIITCDQSVTYKTYSHVTVGQQEATAQVMGTMLRGV